MEEAPARDEPTGGVDGGCAHAVVALARRARPRCGDTVVVAVDGPSGSGKTTLARRIGFLLPAPVLPVEDLCPGWDGLAAAVGILTRCVLEPLARGEPGAYRRWDWVRDDEGERVTVPPGRFLVLEGCGASVSPAGGHAAVRVWMDADAAVRRRRGLERDGESYRPHWQRWARQEAALFAVDRPWERADLLVDTTFPGRDGDTMPRIP